MEGKRIRLNKNSDTLFDNIRLYISLVCIVKGIEITRNDNLIIAHFMKDGFNEVTKDNIINMQLVKNKQVLTNAICKYRKIGLIVRDNHSETLCSDLNISLAKDVNLVEIVLTNK